MKMGKRVWDRLVASIKKANTFSIKPRAPWQACQWNTGCHVFFSLLFRLFFLLIDETAFVFMLGKSTGFFFLSAAALFRSYCLLDVWICFNRIDCEHKYIYNERFLFYHLIGNRFSKYRENTSWCFSIEQCYMLHTLWTWRG